MSRLVRSGDGPIFRSTAPEWLEMLLLRGRLLAKKLGAEDEQCILFADKLREAALMGRLRATFTHIPHEVGGGAKNAVLRYSLAKALGLVTGSADYVFLWKPMSYEQPSDHPVRPPPVAWFGGCWIEMKRAKRAKTETRKADRGGQLTRPQLAFRDWCELNGVPYHLVTTAAEALHILRGYGVLDAEPGV